MRANFWCRLGTGAMVVMVMSLVYWAIRSGTVRFEAIRDSVLPAFLWMWWFGDISDKRQARIVARRIRGMSEAEREQYFVDYPKDKLLVDRINPKYAFGMAIGAAAIISYMWGVEASTPRDSWFRLVFFAVLCLLVLLWLSLVWWPSAQTAQELSLKLWLRESRAWERIKKRYRKVKTVDDYVALVVGDLRHRVSGEDPMGQLARDVTLVGFKGRALSHKELVVAIGAASDDHVAEKLSEAKRSMEAYIRALGQKVVDANEAAKAAKG